MKLPTLSDVEDACDRHGGHDGYDSPDDSFPDDQPNGKYGTGTGAATSNQTTPAPGLGLRSVAPSPRSEALRLEEEHLAVEQDCICEGWRPLTRSRRPGPFAGTFAEVWCSDAHVAIVEAAGPTTLDDGTGRPQVLVHLVSALFAPCLLYTSPSPRDS